MEAEYSVVGFVAGVLMGLTGMGGGVVVTPLLLAFGVSPVTAVGTDLAFGAITKAVGTAQHARSRTIERRVVLRLASGSVPGALLAVLVLRLLHTQNAETTNLIIERGIGVILMLVAVITLANLALPSRLQGTLAREDGAVRPPRAAVLVPAGFMVGFAVGITSIGSGTLLMGLLVVLWPASALTLVGTDLAHGVVLTSVAAAGHAVTGDVNPALLGTLLLGSLPGIVIGTRLATRLPNRALKGAFAMLLFAVGVRLV